MQIKEDPNKGTYVKDLTSVIVKNVSDTEKAMFYGLKNRKTGETEMNKDSSRSHSIFTIYIETASEEEKTGKWQPAEGCLYFITMDFQHVEEGAESS